MEIIKKIITDGKIDGPGSYFQIHKKIESEKLSRNVRADKSIKIAILSSFTTTGIKEVLNVKCCGLGIMPEFYVANYNQYVQEIADKSSPLYKFAPDVTIVFIDTMSLLGDIFFFPYRFSDEERKKVSDEKRAELTGLINMLSGNLPGKIIFHNFKVPTYSPMGVLEDKQGFGFFEMVRTLNGRLAEDFKKDSQVFIFDYDSFCSRHGKERIFDHRMYYLGDIKLNFDFIPLLGDEYMGFIKPIKSIVKKCLVLDLDNTLWGGIVGEEGFEGIDLDQTPKGRPFLEFQKHILSLSERGVILAINSSNNPDDALKVLREHPYMVLREKHFSAMKINWDNKISNMKAIASELNIGLDSLVFIDDTRLNREMVKESLPEVLVVELPEDPALYSKTLMEMNDFNTLHITEEDREKGSMYAAQRKREEYKGTLTDITQYLEGLEIVATIEKVNPFTLPRILQLVEKTNQFNMTTRRYSEEDIKKFAADKDRLIASIRVEDKFGDNGIVGAAIVKKEGAIWRIDTFLLSCRVIGRKIEEALLAYIAEEAKKEGAHNLVGEFIPTKKNAPAKDFYRSSGFKAAGNDGEKEIWEFNVRGGYGYPHFIKIIKK